MARSSEQIIGIPCKERRDAVDTTIPEKPKQLWFHKDNLICVSACRCNEERQDWLVVVVRRIRPEPMEKVVKVVNELALKSTKMMFAFSAAYAAKGVEHTSVNLLLGPKVISGLQGGGPLEAFMQAHQSVPKPECNLWNIDKKYASWHGAT